jgi:hypothetical protein
MVKVSEDCVVRYTSTLFGFNIFSMTDNLTLSGLFGSGRVLRYELVRISFVLASGRGHLTHVSERF